MELCELPQGERMEKNMLLTLGLADARALVRALLNITPGLSSRFCYRTTVRQVWTTLVARALAVGRQKLHPASFAGSTLTPGKCHSRLSCLPWLPRWLIRLAQTPTGVKTVKQSFQWSQRTRLHLQGKSSRSFLMNGDVNILGRICNLNFGRFDTWIISKFCCSPAALLRQRLPPWTVDPYSLEQTQHHPAKAHGL